MAATAGRRAAQPRPARDHCLAPARTAAAPTGGHRYTRMFPELPHLTIDPTLLHAIGRAGGACDSARASREQARTVAAGWPVFGQFIAHDITADRPPGTHHDDQALIQNIPSPRLGPECPYGDSPARNPFLVCPQRPAKVLF